MVLRCHDCLRELALSGFSNHQTVHYAPSPHQKDHCYASVLMGTFMGPQAYDGIDVVLYNFGIYDIYQCSVVLAEIF